MCSAGWAKPSGPHPRAGLRPVWFDGLSLLAATERNDGMYEKPMIAPSDDCILPPSGGHG